MDIGLSRWQHVAGHQVNMAEIALRGTALLFDYQMQAARDLLEMQARSAAAFGVPDCSSLFNVADDKARRLFADGAEQLVATARRATETMAEMNRQFGRLVEQQTVNIAEQMRHGIDQFGRHTEQGLLQARSLVEHGLDEMERAAQEARQQASEQPGWQQSARPAEQSRPGETARSGEQRARKETSRTE
jgi:hypothetical protein